MNRKYFFIPLAFLAFLLMPGNVLAQHKSVWKGLDSSFATTPAVSKLNQPSGMGWQAPRRVNSNTELYGVFQKIGDTYLGKGKIKDPITLEVILSRNVEPAIQDIDGCALVGDVIYTTYMDPISYDYTHTATLRSFNAFTGAQVGSSQQVSPLFISEACTTDPLTGEVWGRFAGNVAGDRWEIACVDFRSLERRAVGLARRTYICMGMTTTQQLYAVGMDGNFYKISTTDGSETFIGATGLNPNDYLDESGTAYHMNGAIDPEDNTFYMTYADNNLDCSLVSINLQTGKAEKVADFAETTLGLVVFFPMHSAENDAPAQVTHFTANFLNGSLTGNVSFTLPTKTYAGASMTGQLSYEVRADGELVSSGTGSVGQTVATGNFSLSKQGLHGVEVVATNDAGRGAQLFHSFYAGIDAPLAPQNITASVNPDNGKVTLSWETPQGKNRGYLGELTYTVVRYPDNVTVATGLAATSFSETLDGNRDIQPYTYGVTASNDTFTGVEGFSNKCVYGAALDIPYQADFSDFAFFTTYDVKGDGKSFSVDYIASTQVYLCRQYHNSLFADPGEMDDWLILPKINFQKGKHYKLTIPQFYNDGDMELTIAYSNSVDVSTMTGEILPTTTYPKNTDYQKIEQEFTVSETGAYHVGLHSRITSRSSRGISIRQTFTISEIAGEAVPAAVTQLSGQGGQQGAKTVSLQFVAPSKNVKGETMSSPLKANVYYRNRIVHTVQDVAPGSNVTVDYANENIPDGYASFSVTTENADGNSEPVTTKVYVGCDTPVMDGDVAVVDQLTSQTISWDAVGTVGHEGYYVDPQDVEYIVYDVTYNEEDGTPFYEEIGRVRNATTFSFPDMTGDGEQHETYKGIRAVNSRGQSNIVVSSPFIKGAPYGLPYEETVAGGYVGSRFIWVDESRTSSYIDLGQESYDANSGCFIWTAGANNERASLNTGKISLRGAGNKPVVSFAYYAYVGQNSTISLVVQTPDGTEKVLTSVNMRNLSGDNGWRVITADLSEFKAQEYVIIKFFMNSMRRGDAVMIDAISVHDMLPYNLSILLSAPVTLKAGMEGEVVVSVQNTGENTISNYTVRLSADDEPFYENTFTEPIGSQENKDISIVYKPSATMEDGLVYLLAEVETDLDLDDNDNWMEAEVEVREATAAQPLNVKLVQKKVLTWDSPGETTESIVETCEHLPSYSNGGISTNDIVGQIGEWIVYDGDGQEVYNFSVSYPGRSSLAQAWLVWDTSTPAEEARSAVVGTKYFVSFNPFFGAADDWLISPLLPGVSQNLKFRANVLGTADDTKAGIVEVLYTTDEYDEDNLFDFISSFKSVKRVNLNSFDWTAVEASLPEGTTYFAIRNVSNNGIGVAVSEVDYMKGREAPVAFNIYGDETCISNVKATSTLVYGVKNPELTYAVSAVYANGEESKPVEAVETDDELPTAIEQVTSKSVSGTTYNVAGQRVNENYRGIIIRKGHQVFKTRQ